MFTQQTMFHYAEAYRPEAVAFRAQRTEEILAKPLGQVQAFEQHILRFWAVTYNNVGLQLELKRRGWWQGWR